MTDLQRRLYLVVVIVGIVGGLYFLEQRRAAAPATGQSDSEAAIDVPTVNSKAMRFARAKELVAPAGFINTEPFRITDLIGRQVILVDFWTYSCINCQRTLPYLNAWQEKYGDMGLTIVGVHTPEFEFEQRRENVEAAVAKYGVTYPVVQDNAYATWRAYGNRYWPRKYLIDIDGYIVYDHIGEGAYEETEQKIQELLRERQERRGEAMPKLAEVTSAASPTAGARTPEIYFGAQRNELLGNGRRGKVGRQVFTAPAELAPDTLYLVGTWNVQPEYAESVSEDARVLVRYDARSVNVVAGAAEARPILVRRDTAPVGTTAGTAVQAGQTIVQEEDLYNIVNDPQAGEHVLELVIPKAGVQLFTFTFG